jgi:hypothetical protein
MHLGRLPYIGKVLNYAAANIYLGERCAVSLCQRAGVAQAIFINPSFIKYTSRKKKDAAKKRSVLACLR